MEFNVGEIVRIKSYDRLPVELKNHGMAKIAGKQGVLVDKLYSEQKGTVYKIHLDGYKCCSSAELVESSLERAVTLKAEYTYEFEFLENLVIARFYEIRDGKKTELEKGHGHVFHDGLEGITQAASYALKKIYEKISGGNI